MFVVKSFEGLFDNYFLMGAVCEETAHGKRYLFSRDSQADSPVEGMIEFHGDPKGFFLSQSELSVPENYICRVQFDQRYIGITLNVEGEVETYRRRNDTRILDEGLHIYVAASPGPFFMRIEAGAHLRFTALYFVERFFEDNKINLPHDFWQVSERVFSAGEHHIPGLDVIRHNMLGTPLTGRAYEAFTRGQGITAAALLIDYLEKTKRNVALPDEITKQVVHQAKYILKKEYVHPPTIQALAKRLGTNKNKLQKGFTDLEGKSVSAYLRSIRMEHALDLLAETEIPIESIAEQVGYQGKTNFYRAFCKTYDHSPKEIRSLIRNSIYPG